jgi:hypothetical protein
VRGERECPAPRLRLDFAGERLAGIEFTTRDHDVGTGPGEGAHHLASEAAAAAGYERDFVLEDLFGH